MAKRRRGGQRLATHNRSAPRRGPRTFLPEGTQTAEDPARESAADSGSEGGTCDGELAGRASASSNKTGKPLASATGCDSVQPRPRVLDTLSIAELVATYGKGFELLQRMGFVAGGRGLRSDSLAAPLRVHNQGRSRKGVHAADDAEKLAVADPIVPTASRSMNELLMEVLASMEEEGDGEEAEELRQLAACVGLEGSLAAFAVGSALDPEEPEPKRRRRTNVANSSAEVATVEQEALAAVQQSFRSDGDFPVELEGQAKHLHWNTRWKQELGSYRDFVDRHDDIFQVICCPAPHGPLVLPCRPDLTEVWAQGRRYVAWCHKCRLAATGKTKRKWKHVERMVARICQRKASTSDSDHGECRNLAAEAAPDFQLRAGLFDIEITKGEDPQLPPSSQEVDALDWFEDVQGGPC